VVEVSYLDHTPAWSDKGRVRLSLLAVDLPISNRASCCITAALSPDDAAWDFRELPGHALRSSGIERPATRPDRAGNYNGSNSAG